MKGIKEGTTKRDGQKDYPKTDRPRIDPPAIKKISIKRMFDLNKDVEYILGRPNFECGSIAIHLREKGHIIECKSEKEQAYVIHWLLLIYEKHGDKWGEVAQAYLNAKSSEAEG